MLVDVNELIRQVLTLTMHKMGSSNIGLKTNFATKPAPLVRADPVQLQQVVLNLIVNAIEAMSSSAGRTRELRLRTEIDPADAVLITIADTGPGIDPKVDRQHLQAVLHDETRRHGDGTVDMQIDRRVAWRPADGDTRQAWRVSIRDTPAACRHRRQVTNENATRRHQRLERAEELRDR